MLGYKELSEKVLFNFNDAYTVFKNKATTYSALRRLMNQGLLRKIRNDLYSCVNPMTQEIFANKFQIASSINSDSYVSHYSAFEIYGHTNQVYNVVYVSSSIHFNNFSFEGIKYICIKTDKKFGVGEIAYSYKTKVTDIERTIIDSIHSIDKISSLDEIINNIKLVKKIDEEKMLKYLKKYNIQSLYQKVAFILFILKDYLKLKEDFFSKLKANINKSIRYLNNESKIEGEYISSFRLVVPKWLLHKEEEENKNEL